MTKPVLLEKVILLKDSLERRKVVVHFMYYLLICSWDCDQGLQPFLHRRITAFIAVFLPILESLPYSDVLLLMASEQEDKIK